MQRIGARLQTDINDGARLPAVFRLGDLLSIELLNGVNGQDGSRIAKNARGIHHALRRESLDRIDPVQDVYVMLVAHPVRALAPLSAPRVEVHAGAQLQ